MGTPGVYPEWCADVQRYGGEGEIGVYADKVVQ
jgi:hypothetical protein